MTRIDRQEETTPRPAKPDASDAIDAHAVHDGDFKGTKAELPQGRDFEDFHFREPGTVVVLAASGTFLRNHVGGVVLQSSEKEMVRIAARRDIALVTHEHAGRDFAKGEGPSHTVCKVLPSPEPRAAVSGALL